MQQPSTNKKKADSACARAGAAAQKQEAGGAENLHEYEEADSACARAGAAVRKPEAFFYVHIYFFVQMPSQLDMQGAARANVRPPLEGALQPARQGQGARSA